jgi:membrane protein YdbS with pleckstrin-like domain
MSLRYRRIAAAILLAIAAAHIFWPSHVQIDWPTISLIVIALILIFTSEIAAILPQIKRFRLGEAEIEMRDLIKLHEEVEIAETETTPASQRQAVDQTGTIKRRSETYILTLASRDKESALVLLAIEIEKELARLTSQTGVPDQSRTIRQTVDALVAKGILSREVANAIISFRNVRNQVIHPIRQNVVDDAVLTSALDSGVRILRILRSR